MNITAQTKWIKTLKSYIKEQKPIPKLYHIMEKILNLKNSQTVGGAQQYYST